MSEWRPIETAPKDGTKLLGWVPDDLLFRPWLYTVIYWDNNAWVREGDDFDLTTEPTLWQPLPAPPSSPSLERRG